MADQARDEYLRVHGAHPDQNKKGPDKPPEGTEIRLPGGGVGHKRTR